MAPSDGEIMALESQITAEEASACGFFKLLGEIRNQIYELALIDNLRKIVVKESLPNQPALLQICRQIRDEATGIFYSKNQFKLEVHYPSPTAGLPSEHHWVWKSSGSTGPAMVVFGRVPWAVIKDWLLLHHSGAIQIKSVASSLCVHSLMGLMFSYTNLFKIMGHSAAKTVDLLERALKRREDGTCGRSWEEEVDIELSRCSGSNPGNGSFPGDERE